MIFELIESTDTEETEETIEDYIPSSLPPTPPPFQVVSLMFMYCQRLLSASPCRRSARTPSSDPGSPASL